MRDNTDQDHFSPQKVDRFSKLDHSERWMRDALKSVDSAGFIESLEVDMTQAKAVISELRRSGVRVTYTHLMVRAAAMVLERRPELHQMVAGTYRLSPGTVDIGLSVSAGMFVAPVLIIQDAAAKTIREIAAEVEQRTPEVREQQVRFLNTLRTWGRLVPFGMIRRWWLRTLIDSIPFRRRSVGTFQVSCVPTVDQIVPLLFTSTAILGVGRVRDRVKAEKGQPVVRPTAILSCCVDHKVWDGVMASSFLNGLEEVLNSKELKSMIE
jgi:pyruvate/2-oxoglutarate dehydrogenase complex dihydrolipoamide acyltransferase (E2) component